ncbi:hypothetical protein M378DRAFT_173552, partial [Amanita muscaria Koide BX008]
VEEWFGTRNKRRAVMEKVRTWRVVEAGLGRGCTVLWNTVATLPLALKPLWEGITAANCVANLKFDDETIER